MVVVSDLGHGPKKALGLHPVHHINDQFCSYLNNKM